MEEHCRKFTVEERFVCRTEGDRVLVGDNLCKDDASRDIVLRSSDGEEFKAHQCLLSMASSYFEAMFNSGMKECLGEVDVQFKSTVVDSLINYIYQGVLSVNNESFEQIFLMVHLFQLQSALTFMTDILCESVEKENTLELYEMSVSFNIPRLKVSVIDCILGVPIGDVHLDKFPLEVMKMVLVSDELMVNQESQVLEIIQSWIRVDEGRALHILDLLRCVRIPHLREVEVEVWRAELSFLEEFNILVESTDWLNEVDPKMLKKRKYSDVHIHAFWAEDSLCEYNFETMRARGVEQPLWMFDTSSYSLECSFLGEEPKTEIETCNQDYLSCSAMDALIIREDWTKRPSFAVGPDLHITYHDTLRRVADMRGGWGSPDFEIAFLKVPIAKNGLTSRRSQCQRRSFNFDYFKSRICCATQAEVDIIFVIGAFTDPHDGPELFFIRICRCNPRDDWHYDDEVECLTEEIELFKEYTPICCVACPNNKLAVVSRHDIKIFDLSDTTQMVNLEFSISLEFEIGVTAWVKGDILFVYLIDRNSDIFDNSEEEPPKTHFIAGYSVKEFDKEFQHPLEFPLNDCGYPKDVRALIMRDITYIIYKPIPRYKVAFEEALYVFRYKERFQTLAKVDQFEVLRFAKSDRFPTKNVVYERDLVCFVPTDMMSCEHSTLLEEYCRKYSLEENCDAFKLAKLREFML